MKDANPRIFRKLEKVAGPGEFDTIVAAAVASYGALRNPSEAQARDFARLVLPVWDKLLAETRRSLAAALSNSSRVPRAIVDKLLGEPLETAAPFLVASPVLTDDDRLLFTQKRDRRFQHPAEPARPDAPVEAPAGQPASVAPRAPAPPAQLPEEQPLSPAKHVPGEAAASVRETLRRMVQPGGSAAVASTGRTLPRTLADLVAMAVHRDVEQAYETIADMTGIDASSLARIEQDESGECLAVALKALGVGATDALTMMMMMKPRIGLDTAAFDVMARYYDTLQPGACALLLGGRRRIQAPAMQPQFEDIETAERPAPRATFGRRSTRPEAPDAKARSA